MIRICNNATEPCGKVMDFYCPSLELGPVYTDCMLTAAYFPEEPWPVDRSVTRILRIFITPRDFECAEMRVSEEDLEVGKKYMERFRRSREREFAPSNETEIIIQYKKKIKRR